MKCDWCLRTATQKINLHYGGEMFGCPQHVTLARIDYKRELVGTE